MNESKLVKIINEKAKLVTELIVVDKNTGVVYRRNLDWEIFGGPLYHKLGEVSQETIKSGKLHKNIHLQENFEEQIQGYEWYPGLLLGGIIFHDKTIDELREEKRMKNIWKYRSNN